MDDEIETVWTYSEEEKALGHRMRALTSRTDKCDYCGAMVNDCQNWPGEGGGTVWEPCKRAPLKTPNVQIEGLRAFAQSLSNAGLGQNHK